MKIIDCESVDSTYTSLENIFACNRQFINGFFDSLHLESFYQDNSIHITPDKLILQKFEEQISQIGSSDATFWFHHTRTSKNNKFEEGILPLGQYLDPIWNFLFSLIKNNFSKQDWQNFKKGIETNYSEGGTGLYHYRLKTQDSLHWGPYAFLVNEVGLYRSSETWSHNYCSAPEIIEDICFCFQTKYGIDLLTIYEENTRPCFVKFIENESHRSYIGIALFYLHNIYFNRQMSIDCNTCFDGKGEAIPKERISKIEFL